MITAFRHLLLLTLLLGVTLSCARWKVDDMSPRQSILIPFGKEPAELSVLRNDTGIFFTPEAVHWNETFYYIVNHYRNKILIISRKNGEVQELIRNVTKGEKPVKETENQPYLDTIVAELKKKIQSNEKLNASPGRFISKASSNLKITELPLFSPRHIAVDYDDNIAVSVRLSEEKREFQQNYSNGYTKEHAPTSYFKILILNKQRTVVRELWMDEAAKTPFPGISALISLPKNRLGIIFRKASDQWGVYIYHLEDKKFGFQHSINSTDIAALDDQAKSEGYKLFIENVLLSPDKKPDIYTSVSFYKDNRFKYRKIFLLPTTPKAQWKFFTEFLEPQNELFAALDDEIVYFWSSENYNQVLLRLFDSGGDLVSNRKLTLFGPDESWRNFLADSRGNIVSLYANRIGLELILWSH